MPFHSPLRASVVVATCVSLAMLAASPACAPSAELEGRPCPCAEGYRCCDPAGICIAENATCAAGAITSADTVARICAEPHGSPLPPPRTAVSLVQFLARRWFTCEVDRTAPSTAIVAHEGIEFAADETWAFLRPTANGYERSPDPADQGTYKPFNDRLGVLVDPTDTTPGHDLHIQWVHGSIVLNLFFDFEQGPLRFRTIDGGELWFAGEGGEAGGDGRGLIGDEGTSCDTDHGSCKPGKTCVSVVSANLCEQPAANLPAGAGCDQMGVRTCAPPLTCLPGPKQCGKPQ